MKKYICTIALIFPLIQATNPTYRKLPLSPSETQKIINDLYKDKNGFFISSDEREWIGTRGGDATYGEITFKALQTILNDLKLTDKDVFVDLGCGVGKACFQVALTTPARAKGYELSATRIGHAKKAKREYNQKNYIPLGKKVEFLEQDMKDARLLDATVVFMCSTCFSDDLMQQMTRKLAKKKSGLRVITLKKLPRNNQFTLIKTYMLPMTWAQETPVYIYQLDKK